MPTRPRFMRLMSCAVLLLAVFAVIPIAAVADTKAPLVSVQLSTPKSTWESDELPIVEWVVRYNGTEAVQLGTYPDSVFVWSVKRDGKVVRPRHFGRVRSYNPQETFVTKNTRAIAPGESFQGTLGFQSWPTRSVESMKILNSWDNATDIYDLTEPGSYEVVGAYFYKLPRDLSTPKRLRGKTISVRSNPVLLDLR